MKKPVVSDSEESSEEEEELVVAAPTGRSRSSDVMLRSKTRAKKKAVAGSEDDDSDVADIMAEIAAGVAAEGDFMPRRPKNDKGSADDGVFTIRNLGAPGRSHAM